MWSPCPCVQYDVCKHYKKEKIYGISFGLFLTMLLELNFMYIPWPIIQLLVQCVLAIVVKGNNPIPFN